MRADLKLIASWIEPGSRALDLGCGSGDLLDALKKKGVTGSGIEIQEHKAARCIARGLSVIHGDIDEEVRDYPDQAFDYVVLSQTLQQVRSPDRLIAEMLRIGRRGVVSFPNFSHYDNRCQLFFKGRAPVSRELPYDWFDTPNIRVITIKDFRRFCDRFGFRVARQAALGRGGLELAGRSVRLLPNLLAAYGVFLLEARSEGDADLA